VLKVTGSRTDCRNHARLTLVAEERILQNLRQLALPKGQMSRVLVDGSDAFFEGEEALVDFGALETRVLVAGCPISTPFTARQVDECKLGRVLLDTARHGQLQDGMGTG
jgi:hypothetical protein